MPGMPPPTSDERSSLLVYLEQARHVLRLSAYGLTAEQAAQSPTVSSLCIGGLIKHVAAVERFWIDLGVPGRATDGPEQEHGEDDYMALFRFGRDESLEALLADYAKEAERTEAAIAGVADLGQPVPVPKDVPWFPKDVEAWSVRWVLLHLIEETTRHAGHADIVRESIDGATAFPLMAAEEGWPETPWMKPWKPTE